MGKTPFSLTPRLTDDVQTFTGLLEFRGVDLPVKVEVYYYNDVGMLAATLRGPKRSVVRETRAIPRDQLTTELIEQLANDAVISYHAFLEESFQYFQQFKQED